MNTSDIILGTNPVTTASSIINNAKKPTNTIKLKQQYDAANIEAQSNGQDFPDWPTWLDQQGYSLDNKGLVFPKSK